MHCLSTLKYRSIKFADIITVDMSKVTSLYYHNNKAIALSKETIYVINLEKINCEMEIINTIKGHGFMRFKSINDENVCFVFSNSVSFLNLVTGELINKTVMFPKDLLSLEPLRTYFDGDAYLYIYGHCVYVWDVRNDKVLMRNPLKQVLKNERSNILYSSVKIKDNYIDFFFGNSKVSVDYINSNVVEQSYLENYENKYQVVRTFKHIEENHALGNAEKRERVDVWLFDKVIFIQDSLNKTVFCEGEHGLKIGQANREPIEVVKQNNQVYVLMTNNIIICDLIDGSIKSHYSNINPKYLRRIIENKMDIYINKGSLSISEECIIYKNEITENISAIPLNNNNAFINDDYIYLNTDGNPIRLLPLNTSW